MSTSNPPVASHHITSRVDNLNVATCLPVGYSIFARENKPCAGATAEEANRLGWKCGVQCGVKKEDVRIVWENVGTKSQINTLLSLNTTRRTFIIQAWQHAVEQAIKQYRQTGQRVHIGSKVDRNPLVSLYVENGELLIYFRSASHKAAHTLRWEEADKIGELVIRNS